jgi:hypothetical protein
MSADFEKLQESVAKLVTDARDDQRLRQQIEADPESTLKTRVPQATANMQPEQVRHFAGLVLDGVARWDELQKGSGGGGELTDKHMLCPACQPTIFAALLTAGIATVIGTGGTAVAALAPVVTAVTGLAGPAAVAAIQAALAHPGAGAAGVAAINALVNAIAAEACKRLGC